MSLTEIVFRLFARVRPLLWYYHRLSYFLRMAIRCLEDDDYCLWLHDNPKARADFESKLTDGERCLETAIAFRVREILGLPMPVTTRIGIAGRHRLHSPTGLVRLAARLDRLVDRYNAIERLARLRAARLRREMEAAPVTFGPAPFSGVDDDDSGIPNPAKNFLPSNPADFPRGPAGDSGASARSRAAAIRGPPRCVSIADCRLPIASRHTPARTRAHVLDSRPQNAGPERAQASRTQPLFHRLDLGGPVAFGVRPFLPRQPGDPAHSSGP